MTEMLQVSSASRTHPGRKRRNNEDFPIFFEPGKLEDLEASGRLYIVADGVGGAAKGERASRYAAEKVLFDYYRNPQLDPGLRLKQAMEQASDDIYAFTEQQFTSPMATTMAAAVIRKNMLTVANVGDSRVYLIRGDQVHQITKDHSVVGEMVRNGVITADEAEQSKAKNRLTRSMGGEADVLVDVFPDLPLQPGDRILLCSDGLTRYVSLDDVVKLASPASVETAAEGMIDYANRRGGADNISVILIEVSQPFAGIAPEYLKPRGQVPTQVDWETIVHETEYPRRRERTGIVDLLSKIPTIYLMLIAVMLSLICITGAVLIFATYRVWRHENVGVTSMAASGPTFTAQWTQTTAPGTATQLAMSRGITQTDMAISIAGSVVAGNSVVPQVTIVPPTPMPITSNTFTPEANIATVEPNGGCVYQVQSDDRLEKILPKFNQVFIQYRDYFYYEGNECTEEKNKKLNCSGRDTITDNNQISKDWWILIESVDINKAIDKAQCESVQYGRWMTPE